MSTPSLVATSFALAMTGCTVDPALDPMPDPGAEPASRAIEASAFNACPANTPSALAPAATSDLAFVLDAQGVQRYTCTGSPTAGFAWSFIAPDADLFDREPHHLAIHHFAGPTWVYRDSSSVVAARAAGVSVDATAIPWLLLNVTKHGGREGRMTDITQIQRLDTAGGLAPVTGCDADHVGAESDVLYTARYFFYRDSEQPNRTRCGG